jgi:hypothetical protein
VLATNAELPIEMEEGVRKKGEKNLWQLLAHVQKPSSRRGELPWFRYQGADPSNH